ncbi:MAG TPA: hypothetical protein PLF41_12300, partial [Anaerolineales bacterium]|nr:hypothetical protein [Anaerolineales bacterium]
MNAYLWSRLLALDLRVAYEIVGRDTSRALRLRYRSAQRVRDYSTTELESNHAPKFCFVLDLPRDLITSNTRGMMSEYI